MNSTSDERCSQCLGTAMSGSACQQCNRGICSSFELAGCWEYLRTPGEAQKRYVWLCADCAAEGDP